MERKFRIKYDNHKRVHCEPGSPIRIVYGSELDKNHNIVVKEKGTDNLYAYINSFADSVDINVLLARFTNGDQQALMQRAASYIDISSLPTNMNDFVQFSRSATSFFDTLPIEVKQKFDNNVLTFISMVGTKEWNEIMDTTAYAEKKAVEKKSAEISKKLKDEVNHVPTVVPSVFDDGNIPVEPPKEGGDIQ